ncbi:hypothetical protein HZB94_00720 [Candidatus Falkowbacteria bacterium]|nr:hypothetical protein [Candidatus Falkowbacteria bacterium]
MSIFETLITKALTEKAGACEEKKKRENESAEIKAMRKTVKKYAESHQISTDLAEKFVFRDTAEKLRDESSATIISARSENLQQFFALLEASLDDEQKAKLRQKDQPAFKALGYEEIKVGAPEQDSARQYIETKYPGAKPADAVIAELAQMHKIFQALAERISAIDHELLACEWNLSKLLAEKPEISADIAKLQQVQQAIFEIEKRCDPRAEIDQMIVKFEKQKQEALSNALWKPVISWLKAWPRAAMITWYGGIIIGLPVATLYLMAETVRLIARAGYQGTKLLLEWKKFTKKQDEIQRKAEQPAAA